jgi:prepilin-type N-terminal cleavage/methylation domain-containing protein
MQNTGGIMRRNAFTMVELIVVIALASLFSIVVFRMFSGSTTSQKAAMADLSMQSRVLTTQNRVIRMIREGTDFLLPEIGEPSSALFFADFMGNVQVLYQLKDTDLSASTGKELYKLMHYRVKVENFDIGNPVYDPDQSSLVADHIKDISFLVTSANSVNVTASFASEKRDFQTMFEAGLQNTGGIQ